MSQSTITCPELFRGQNCWQLTFMLRSLIRRVAMSVRLYYIIVATFTNCITVTYKLYLTQKEQLSFLPSDTVCLGN
jgi:hypothetical protein